MTLDLIVSGILITFIYTSSIYTLYRFVKIFRSGQSPVENYESQPSNTKIIYRLGVVFFSFFGWAIFLYHGIDGALFFLPWSWGYTEGFDMFVSFRGAISTLLAIVGSYYVHHIAIMLLVWNHQRREHTDCWLCKNGIGVAESWRIW